MGRQNVFGPFIVVLVVAVALQAGLIGLDQQQTPLRVAKAFTKDYFYLDPAMQDYLCDSLAADGRAVDQYLYEKKSEAAERGRPLSYLRSMFTQMHFDIVSQDAKSAHIHVSGVTRTAINPAFMVIGKLFRIGQDTEVDGTLELVKQENGWRVCGEPFDLRPAD